MQLTGLADLLIILLAREFNVDKVDLEFLVGLDTDQKRRTTAGGDGFVGVVLRLEDKGKGTLELLENGLDEFSESDALVWLGIVDVFRKNGNGLGVGFALKFVATVLENEADGVAVGDDTIVYDEEIAGRIGAQRMAVSNRGGAMGCPASVCDRNL